MGTRTGSMPLNSLPLVVATTLLLSSVALAQTEASAAARTDSSTVYLVVYRPGPEWIEGRPVTEQPLREHGRYVIRLYSEGRMIQAGPFNDAPGGAMLLTVGSLDEAKRILEEDPAVVDGIMIPELFTWHRRDWSRLLPP